MQSENFEEADLYSVRQILAQKDIQVTDKQYRQIRLRAAETYKLSKGKDPEKVEISNGFYRYIYAKADIQYVLEATRVVLGL